MIPCWYVNMRESVSFDIWASSQENLSLEFLTRSSSNQSAQLQRLGRNLKLYIYRGSYMSAHVLLKLLNKLRKKNIKCEACRAF